MSAQHRSKQAFITGLPRCRTFWFAAYFDGLEGVTAYHEVLNGLKSKQDFYDAMEEPSTQHVINSDSGLYITDFQTRYPEAPTVVIHRDLDECYESLCNFMHEQGYDEKPSFDFLVKQEAAISAIKGLHLDFESIDEALPDIHQYLVGTPYDRQYAEKMMHQTLQLELLTTDVDSYRVWTELGG